MRAEGPPQSSITTPRFVSHGHMNASPSTTLIHSHHASIPIFDDVDSAHGNPTASPHVSPPPPSASEVSIAGQLRFQSENTSSGVSVIAGDVDMTDEVDVKSRNNLDTSSNMPPGADEGTAQTPENNNHDASPSDTSVATHPAPDDDDTDKPPPAKRARRLSDSERASLVHVRFSVAPAMSRVN